MVLVSNFYGNISVVLREFGFVGLFDHIIESAVVGIRKPDPRIFQLGVDALGLKPEEVIVVGDSIDKDIIPAKSVGCHTVWFKGEPWENMPVHSGATPAPPVHSSGVLAAAPADRIITDLNQLLA